MALTSCSDGPGDPPPPPPMEVLDPCGGRCTNVQLCVMDDKGVPGCAMICANQFHCWSGCCLAAGDTGYNVCRPRTDCFSQ